MLNFPDFHGFDNWIIKFVVDTASHKNSTLITKVTNVPWFCFYFSLSLFTTSTEPQECFAGIFITTLRMAAVSLLHGLCIYRSYRTLGRHFIHINGIENKKLCKQRKSMKHFKSLHNYSGIQRTPTKHPLNFGCYLPPKFQ